MIVLDTNIVSYLMREDPVVLEWADGFQRRDLTTTAITRAEVRFGIARLPDGVRRSRLAERAQVVLGSLSDRILAFDGRAADVYGDLLARLERQGSPIGREDTQIAAIVLSRGDTLATRNTKHFATTGVALIDPFE